MIDYDLPEEILITAEGTIRIVTLNRPEALNATDEILHEGLAELFGQLESDREARAVVLTGAGRASPPGATSATSTSSPLMRTCAGLPWWRVARSSPAWSGAGCPSSPR